MPRIYTIIVLLFATWVLLVLIGWAVSRIIS